MENEDKFPLHTAAREGRGELVLNYMTRIITTNRRLQCLQLKHCSRLVFKYRIIRNAVHVFDSQIQNYHSERMMMVVTLFTGRHLPTTWK